MPEHGSKTSMVPVTWASFGIFSAQSKWCCHDWRPRKKPGYITTTWRQSNNQWSGGILAHPAQKNSKCKNLLEKFSPRFFGIKTASSSLIIFQRIKLSMQSITHLCWCNWRTFWRENAAGRSPKGSCSCTTMPRLTGHLQPRRNWSTWASSVLITHPILRIWPPLDYHLLPGLKKQLKGHHFSSDMEFTAVMETWLDVQLSEFFFEWLTKVRATG